MNQSNTKKVLLIGWDAADWEMIDPLLQSGQMPALAQLLKGGVRGNLATIQPVLSPMLWTSIATGKRADKHGIFGFTEPLPDGTGIVPVRSTSRKCKAIWNILSQNGLSSNVVGWFATDPPEPISGTMVSDQFLVAAKNKTVNSVHPPELASSLAALRVLPDDLMAEDLLAFIPRLKELDLKTDDRPIKLARRLAKAASVQAIATSLIQSQPWNLMAVYFDAIDQFGHEFMSYHPPRMPGIVPEKDFEFYQHVMTGCYRFHDMMLGALLQYIDVDTNVILVSDHGYESGHRRLSLEDAKKNPEGCHRSFGIACMKGPDFKKNETLYGASILDVTPTILSLLGLPVGGDMDGRPWLEVFNEHLKPERIFGWEGLSDGEAGLHRSEIRQDPAEAAQAIAQLVELGYITPPGKDVQETVQSTIRCNKINLVRALTDTPRMAQAVPLLRELLAEKQDDEWCVLALASCLIALGQLKEAQALLGTISIEAQHSAQVQLMLADLALADGDKTKAISHVEAANANGYPHHLMFNQVGRAFLQFERWPEAAEAFQKSLETEPDNPIALDGLASVHLAKQEWESAVEKSLEAVGLAHFYPEAHFHLALGLEHSGQIQAAIIAYETALGLGYQPAILHRHLMELFRPIDAEKVKEHKRAFVRLRRQPMYHVDFKSNLTQETSAAR